MEVEESRVSSSSMPGEDPPQGAPSPPSCTTTGDRQDNQAVSSSQDGLTVRTSQQLIDELTMMPKIGNGAFTDNMASSSDQGLNMMASSSSQVDGAAVEDGIADSSCSPAMDPQFAASLREKLENLSGPTACRSRDSENSDYENPSSMETQGDALCLGSGPQSPASGGSRDPLVAFDDLPVSPHSFSSPHQLTTYGPLPDPDANYDDTLIGPLFQEDPPADGDLMGEGVPGIVGLRNIGNTCFMNAGLQCLVATQPIVSMYLKLQLEEKVTDEAKAHANSVTLLKEFSSFTEQVHGGQYQVLQPNRLKDAISAIHEQFQGFRQHDCQEFLAQLLDALHESSLALGVGGRPGPRPLSECTSMELHTPHSTEASGTEMGSVFNFSGTGALLDKEGEISCRTMGELDRGNLERTNMGDLEREFESVSEVCRADLESVTNLDGMESRGSASPKSYTSHSSLEDKIPSSIRMAPIPETVKASWGSRSAGSGASLDSGEEEEDSSNLVPPDMLRKKQVVFSESVSPGTTRNNAVSPMNVGIEDFLKEHKTSNVNMNSETQAINMDRESQEMNNKINFDSEKYRHSENTRPLATIENLNTSTESQSGEKVSKRTKCTNMEAGREEEAKRARVETGREKNIAMEVERREVEVLEEQSEPPSCCSEAARDPARLKEAIEADRYWEKHLAKNNTVVARTFQGQFRNTVICSECSHVSVSFEPFMFLSVPLPRALERQLEVGVIVGGAAPTLHLVTLPSHGQVADLRRAITSKLDIEDRKLAVVEVARHKVHRTLEDKMLLKFLNTTTRRVYCLELLGIEDDSREDLATSAMSSLSSSRSDLCPSTTVSSSTSTGTLTDTGTITEEQPAPAPAPWRSCNICLEDMVDSDLLSHIHCTAVLCRDCLDRSLRASPDKCPVCMEMCTPDEWVQLDLAGGVKPPLRMLTLNLLFTMETEEGVTRLGHPRSLRLANTVSLNSVERLVSGVVSAQVPRVAPVALVIVKEDGEWCSRCSNFPERCRGCTLASLASPEGDLQLKPGDTLAVRFPQLEKNLVEEVNRLRHDPSMEEERLKPVLDLTDCLEAFSVKEVLDGAQAWYCPVCERNRRAVKTLSVWRYPDFLIIHLKRFVFLDHQGLGGGPGAVKLDNRVAFPLQDLDLTPYLSGPLQQGGELFSLYGAVCHSGGLGAGHYTAFARHNDIGQWNYFNDAHVDHGRLPEGEGQDDVYVLFYKRTGYGLSPSSCQDVPVNGSALKICEQQSQARGPLPGPANSTSNYIID